ncbi:MAG: 1-acyl-sn-glycerol-3-phosphate acyltransferase [Simplicispira sp.]|nr:1-acyl-sn-glycerol-3-phosphate acyltransferase [Simplicispira sp.]
MTQAADPGAAPAPRPLQLLRGMRLGVHLLWGAATVALAYPLASAALRLRLKRRWSHQLLCMLGVALEVDWSEAPAGALVVANHISWLDIYALNAAHPMAFVAKADVATWPLVGWLAARTDTVFMRRGVRSDARATNLRIAALLEAGQTVTVFPEGTTTDGSTLLDFHAALLQPAIAAGRPIHPVAISYHGPGGRRSSAAAYAGETSLRACLAAILAGRGLVVRVRAAPPLPTAGAQRRALAVAAHGAVAARLALPTAPPPAPTQPGATLPDVPSWATGRRWA